MGRHPFGHGHNLSANHKDAVVGTFEVLFHDDGTGMFPRLVEPPSHFLGLVQIDGHAATMRARPAVS